VPVTYKLEAIVTGNPASTPPGIVSGTSFSGRLAYDTDVRAQGLAGGGFIEQHTDPRFLVFVGVDKCTTLIRE